MEEINKDVTVAPSTTPVADATSPAVEGQKQQEVVKTEESPVQGQAPEVKTQEDINWKNRAMEYERKLRETVERIPEVIQEAVKNVKPSEPEQPKYTIADLKAFVDTTDDVNNKKWAYAEIDRLESERISKTVQELTQKERAFAEAQMLKKQYEQEVLGDSRFADAFVDVGGTKQWNFNSPLTIAASQYMRDPALANRPDGMKIAMKLAYADYSAKSAGAIQAKMENTKVENTKLKQATLADGGGVNANVSKPNPIAQAQEELAKTGSRTALRTLTQAILKQQGLIPKE